MYILLCDETNLEQTAVAQFFVYGGLAVPADQVGPLSRRIEQIRGSHGFRPTDRLKFRTASRPKHIDTAQWHSAKGDAITACRDHHAQLISCIVLHDIASQRRARLIEWQLNTVLDAFSARFLVDAKDVGIVIVDRLPDGKEYSLLQRKFTQGGDGRTFGRVVAYAATCDGASHLASATDVVLGTLAYCINQQTRLAQPKVLFQAISPLLWRRAWPNNRVSPVWGYGINLNPATVKHPPYQEQYRRLKEHLAELEMSV